MHRIRVVVIALFAVLAVAPLWAENSSGAGVVNINTAAAEQLQLLPRVGPALAKRIIDFREANGKFKSSDELVAVKGIGEKSLLTLKPYVAVEGKTTLTDKVRLPRKAADNGDPS